MKKLILALYILYLPFQLKLPQLPVINTVNLFLILLIFIFIFSRDANGIRSRFDTPLLIFLFIWIISFLHTLFYPVGIWRFTVTVEFKRLVTLVLGYFVFARCLKTKRELQFLYYMLLISVVLVGLHTWCNGMLAGIHFADFKRSPGPFGVDWRGSDIAGGFLAIFAPFLLSFFLLTKKNILKMISFCGLAICLMGILATYSRGSILALAIASVITILASIRPLLRQSKFYTIIILAILISGLLGWRYWIPEATIARVKGTVEDNIFREKPYSMKRTISADSASFDESSQKRIAIWKAGLELFLSNPLIGAGFKIPQYALGVDTHNAFILIAAEMGILGILVFIWFLWRILIQASSLLDSEFVGLGVGFIGCITAFIVVNMFYSNFFRDTVVGTFWIALGLLAGTKQYVAQKKT